MDPAILMRIHDAFKHAFDQPDVVGSTRIIIRSAGISNPKPMPKPPLNRRGPGGLLSSKSASH